MRCCSCLTATPSAFIGCTTSPKPTTSCQAYCSRAVCITFRPLLKCLKTREEPLAELRAVFEKRCHNLLRQLRWSGAIASSEDICNEGSVADLCQSIRAPARGFDDVQPTGHNKHSRKIARRGGTSQITFERLPFVLV